MEKTDRPVDSDDDKVEEGEDDDEYLVSCYNCILLDLFRATSKSDISEEDSIGHDSSNNEEILDDDPSSESRDTNSNMRAGGDGRHQECCK